MDFKPTAAEIANIWKYIIGNQAHLCFLEHWMYHAEDDELKVILRRSIDEANRIVNQGVDLYQKAGFPIPIGFRLDKDVVPKEPRLMSDKLIFFVLHVLSEYGVYGYGLTLGKTTTPEVLSYFDQNLKNASDLYQSITKIIYNKGHQQQPIYIPAPKQAEMVEKHSFLSGWWGKQRPLTAVEIDGLVFSLRGVILAKTMFIVLAQIAKEPKAKKYCQRGVELCSKRVERIQSLNATENLSFLATYETEATNSSTSPFSEKLIMFEAISLAEIAIARYGNALSTMSRRDLSTMFAFYIAETGTFLDDGLNLMIENKWLDQPPLAAERKQ